MLPLDVGSGPPGQRFYQPWQFSSVLPHGSFKPMLTDAAGSTRVPLHRTSCDSCKPLMGLGARAAVQIVNMLATAKEVGLDEDTALRLVDW